MGYTIYDYFNQEQYVMYDLEDIDKIYRHALENIEQIYSPYQTVLTAVQNDPILLNVPSIGQVTPQFYL